MDPLRSITTTSTVCTGVPLDSLRTRSTRSRSRSQSRSRPTTPLRRPGAAPGTYLNRHGASQQQQPHHTFDAEQADQPDNESGPDESDDESDFPLASLEPLFADLAAETSALNENLQDIQLLHSSLNRFSHGFASLLYGLNMNAFCVDFPEAPIAHSFARAAARRRREEADAAAASASKPSFGAFGQDIDPSFLTSNTSFVENPVTPSKTPRRTAGAASMRKQLYSTRGSRTDTAGGLPPGRTRPARGGATFGPGRRARGAFR